MADSKIAIHGAIAANVAIAVTKFVVAGITGIDLSALWAQATAPQRWAAAFERGGVTTLPVVCRAAPWPRSG